LGKLCVLSAREVCQILEQNGFVEVRQSGNHIIMQLQTDETTITAVVPNYAELRIGTLQSIIRQSGLPRSLFEIMLWLKYIIINVYGKREDKPKFLLENDVNIVDWIENAIAFLVWKCDRASVQILDLS
jgi:predicted RNA binding protein YcfA (HicA-like mRNA interferase family)